MRLSERTLRPLLIALGGLHLALAGWAAFDATSFARTIADFGAQNDHLVHDFAAAAAAFGAGLLVAAYVRSWRVPALVLAGLWTGLHAVSHIVDAHAATPPALGPVEAVALVLVSGLFAALAWATREAAAS